MTPRRLHVELDGQGPPLALLNGAFCTVRQWDRVIGTLAERFTVIRHDVRGTGRSRPGPDDENTFEHYADDLVALLDAHAGSGAGAALWGMAWGARVALVAAARHPDRFGPVVLSDLAIDPADPDAQKAGAAAAKAARAAAGIPEVARPDGTHDHDDPDATARALAATRLHPDLGPFCAEVAAPTLVATGEHDPNLTSSRRAAALLPDARLEVLAHTGHGSVLQRPDLVLDVVLPFLADGSRGGPSVVREA